MPTYPITQPADNAPPYTYTQPIRDAISGVNDHQTRLTALEQLPNAKGDLWTATADNTPARLGVGTNGQVLTATSTAATGLAWTTPTGGGGGSGGFLNAKDYGAVGDGSTNDTAALQAAINAAQYRTLYIPRGQYLINATLKLPSFTHIIGEFLPYRVTEQTVGDPGGAQGTVIEGTFAGAFHMFQNADIVGGNACVWVEGIKFVQGSNSGDWDIFNFHHMWRSGIQHCAFLGGSTTNRRGIHFVETGEQLMVRHCNMEGCGITSDWNNALLISECELSGIGIYITGGGFYNRIRDTHIYFVDLPGSTPSIQLSGVHEGMITGCQVEGGGGHGIYLSHDVRRYSLSGNIIKNMGQGSVAAGIAIDANPQPSTDNLIVGNWIGNTDGTFQDYGVRILATSQGGSSNNLISNNILTGNAVAATNQAAGTSNTFVNNI